MTDPSSITSITEEDDLDESDTTEDSSNSKASDGISSILYSSECNTDDKLTPNLIKISISKSGNPLSKKRQLNQMENEHSEATTSAFPYPYGCNPLPLQHCSRQKVVQPIKKQKRTLAFHSCVKSGGLGLLRTHLSKTPYLPKQEEENFGVDDEENCLYTDFSDTSSKPANTSKNRADSKSDDEDDGTESEPEDGHYKRSYFPDMTSMGWYQARCFDHYWSHYNFVMDWYQQHIRAVHLLSHQMSSTSTIPPTYFPSQTPSASGPGPGPKGVKKKGKRSKRRARNRRLAKSKQRAAEEQALEDQQSSDKISDSDEEENELEMEITDDMLDFFAVSLKHRMERDKKRNEENIDSEKTEGIASIKKGVNGCDGQSLLGPAEQPGARRTAEMKTLYGRGAPMIQGMETALQMTYDKFLDKYQPKLWPNMPLKIVFA